MTLEVILEALQKALIGKVFYVQYLRSPNQPLKKRSPLCRLDGDIIVEPQRIVLDCQVAPGSHELPVRLMHLEGEQLLAQETLPNGDHIVRVSFIEDAYYEYVVPSQQVA